MRREVSYVDALGGSGNLLRVWILIDTDARRGQKVVNFVVQYEATIDGKREPVARYDCAHGRPH